LKKKGKEKVANEGERSFWGDPMESRFIEQGGLDTLTKQKP